MPDMHQQASDSADTVDLSQFYQIFFEEAGENLDLMEQLLLRLNLDAVDDEELNGIFRCAHSVKGGAATFGFTDVAQLTHQMESLLDRLRRHELQPNSEMIDVLLESSDVSRSLLARHQRGAVGTSPSTDALVRRITALASNPAPPSTAATAAVGLPAIAAMRHLEIRIGPLEKPEQADSVQELFRDIPGLGQISLLSSDRTDTRIFAVDTTSSDEDLLDLFEFHVSRTQISIRTLTGSTNQHETTGYGIFDQIAEPPATGFVHDPSPGSSLDSSAGYGFFEGAPGAPKADSAVRSPLTSIVAHAASVIQSSKVIPSTGSSEATTIRVVISKVDQLINLVGELVITQAMLAQNSQALDPAVYQQMLIGLSSLERNTRDLQESVMSIRMIPMSIVFSRFPRMLRDLAGKLGKKVDFVTKGEATELDKGLVEKITDPLTHLVRNSCDHGVELPAQRLAAGKPEIGTITLSATHQGNSIVIEVRDDGRGLSREKILNKARESGLDVSDQMSDAEVWQLIFAPGFSTADVVTDVSGRGVGLDVVKRNISALNGTVEVDSAEGYGMRVSVRLPLTLAIMDGLSVGIGEEVYLLPLSSVIESFQVDETAVNTVGQGSQLVKVREEYMPVVDMGQVLQVSRDCSESCNGIMVVVESDGSRVALLVDELLGQQQVVVKNLESNYRKVAHISGATILGDGKVALILDVAALVRRSRH
jgi:two-component system chemotaxis sensor kinase CheA